MKHQRAAGVGGTRNTRSTRSARRSTKGSSSLLRATPELKEPLPTDSSCNFFSSLAPILQQSTDKIHSPITSEDVLMPPPCSTTVSKAKPLHTPDMAKQVPEVCGPVAQPLLDFDMELTPKIEPEWENAKNLLPKPPIPVDQVDQSDPEQPSLSDISKNCERLKEGSVPHLETEWPLNCMAEQKKSESPPSNVMKCLMFGATDPKSHSQENNVKEGLFDWDVNSKWYRDNLQRRVCNDLPFALNRITTGVEEQQALSDWIKSEGLNEPNSDIEEFNMLLSLAKDYPKNHDLLFKVLKPPTPLTTQAKEVRKRPSMVFEVEPLKPDAMERQIGKPVYYKVVPNISPEYKSPETTVVKPVQNMQLIEYEPENMESILPRPLDEAANQEWLQHCSKTISQQLQLLINEGGATVCLKDFEDIVDENITEFRDPQSKSLASKWYEQYGINSVEHLRRTLTLTPIPVLQEQCLQKIRILRRPTKPKSDPLDLSIELRFCKLFCTLEMNTHLYLEMAVKRVENTVFRSDIGVIEVELGASQMGWVWANGTVMVVNAISYEELDETLCDIVAKTMGTMNFRDDPFHKLLHLRLFSCANFPWSMNLEEFSKDHACSSEPLHREVNFVYYVSKELPGVSARLYESGMFQVFAMTTAEADKMVKQLYLLTASYRKPLSKLESN
ncbi:uncharacterized protein LOC127011050 isoform X2 [Drosophila biarmipes]|uniref:uncharacterized protein LOC127011050 isoform X2 n=1 Tax=Drosophila biarmipes TaxID=125945 RepID=UPI0021CCD98D|nr:uncharacterized protein LOC127011050 isoform X2 [Drosophila biarmipes]